MPTTRRSLRGSRTCELRACSLHEPGPMRRRTTPRQQKKAASLETSATPLWCSVHLQTPTTTREKPGARSPDSTVAAAARVPHVQGRKTDQVDSERQCGGKPRKGERAKTKKLHCGKVVVEESKIICHTAFELQASHALCMYHADLKTRRAPALVYVLLTLHSRSKACG